MTSRGAWELGKNIKWTHLEMRNLGDNLENNRIDYRGFDSFKWVKTFKFLGISNSGG